MSTENAIAKALQTGVPFVSDPWGALGEPLGLSGDAVLAQVRAFVEGGQLREISGVLEGSALGWDSALVAARVAPERLDAVATIVNACPTVTHDYVRDHAYNLWFTIAMPAEIGVDAALAALSRETGVSPLQALRRTATFKIGVRFDLETMENASQKGAIAAPPRRSLDAREKSMLRALQQPLPIEHFPFATLAYENGLREEELLSYARGALGGVLRRYVATFRHRKLGVHGNGMVVWRIDEASLPEIGAMFAEAPEVSHCYARNPIEGFPYSLYTMIHAKDEATVRAVAASMAARVGDPEHAILFSTRELKKTRLRYFQPELEVWWALMAAGRATEAAE
ncbi:MAG: Lrp/AsnC family transcriptional regulator [Deltaproteobacteria bacterium]|nr:Lrp/AsnC family transcriptional regulator [Deltaproteobacteria bacterium]